MFALIALLACDRDDEVVGSSAGGVCALELDRQAIDFGVQRVPELSAPLMETLVLRNTGQGRCELRTIEVLQTGPFSVDPFGLLEVPVGEERSLEVYYLPTGSGQDERILRVVSSDPQTPEQQVLLTGTGLAPVLEVSGEGTLEGVLVGCQDGSTLSLSNVGTLDLELTGFEVEDSAGVFAFDPDPSGSRGPLPWTLAPGESHEVAVVFSPESNITTSIRVVAEASWPELDGGRFGWSGAGVYGEHTDRFLQRDPLQVDVVVAVNGSPGMSLHTPKLASLLEGLKELGEQTDYRVAFVMGDDGCVLGDSPYIEATMDSETVSAVLDAQLCQGKLYGECDAIGSLRESTLALFTAALSPENLSTGGCNAGLLRDDALLELIGFSHEGDSSPGQPLDYLSELQGLKSQAQDVRINGVGGDYPTGCEDALAYTGLYETTVASGGALYSICQSSLTTSMQGLSQDAMLGFGRFPLTHTPLVEVFSVTVRGEPVIGSFSYEKESNSFVFPSGRTPSAGSAVEITYPVLGDCD